MKVLFVVINDLNIFDDLILELANNNISGGTIFESQGLMKNIAARPAVAKLFHNLNRVMNNSSSYNKTLMMVVNDKELEVVKKCVHNVAGHFEDVNSGLMFSIDLDFVEGYGKKGDFDCVDPEEEDL
jgi:hypothetical protein